jgi:hypothetical protein
MFVIEKRAGATGRAKDAKWVPISEWSTRDMAQNIARMQFGKSNPLIRIVEAKK